MNKEKEYVVALIILGVVMMFVMDLTTLLPDPFNLIGTTTVLTLFCPAALAVEHWIFTREEP